MSRLFDEVREEAREQGKELERVNNIKQFMKTFKMTAEQVMDALEIPKSEQPKYLPML